MNCDRCRAKKIRVSVKVKVDRTKDGFVTHENWCANCLVSHAIKSKFKGGEK